MKRALLLLVIGCAPAPVPHHVPAWVSDTKPYGSAASASSPVPSTGASTTPSAVPAAATRPAAPQTGSLAERYREPVSKIVATAHADRDAFKKLAYLTDHIGNRLAGSPQLDRAIAWAAKTM